MVEPRYEWEFYTALRDTGKFMRLADSYLCFNIQPSRVLIAAVRKHRKRTLLQLYIHRTNKPYDLLIELRVFGFEVLKTPNFSLTVTDILEFRESLFRIKNKMKGR